MSQMACLQRMSFCGLGCHILIWDSADWSVVSPGALDASAPGAGEGQIAAVADGHSIPERLRQLHAQRARRRRQNLAFLRLACPDKQLTTSSVSLTSPVPSQLLSLQCAVFGLSRNCVSCCSQLCIAWPVMWCLPRLAPSARQLQQHTNKASIS